MAKVNKCNGCGNPTTYDSGFRQECATIGCQNFRATAEQSQPAPGFNPNNGIPSVAARLAELNAQYPDDCRMCGDELEQSGDVDLCNGCAGMLISIDGDEYVITDIMEHCSGMAMVTVESGEEFYLADDADTAGQAARDYWKQMAQHDPSEFECIVGSENLISMAMGQPCSPGSAVVSSLDEWFDLSLDAPEEHFASHDGNEGQIDEGTGAEALDELGFTPTVAYRHN